MSRKTIAALGLTAALALGAGTAAFAESGSSSPTTAGPVATSPTTSANPATKADRTAARCTRGATAITKLTAAEARLQTRIQTLTQRKAEAEQAGKTAKAAKIGARIDALNTHLSKAKDHVTKIETWTSTHCSGTPTPSSPTTASTTVTPGN
jgi:hypothetical protein